jgi:hypothetical protein
MHGYGMDGWNMGWMWMFGIVLIVLVVVLIMRRSQ